MDVSIVIPSFNTRDLLSRCLNSIKHRGEIIVVDNGSTDGSVDVAKNVKLIQNKQNAGYGVANNQGIRAAKGDIILLLNSDIKVLDDGIEKLYQFAKDHQKAFVGGKLLNEDGSAQSSCGPVFSLWNVFLMLFCKGDTLGFTRWSPDEEKNVSWASGACLMGSKKAFEDVGLFNEEIFMYMDEVEFLERAREKGYSVIFYPHARFIHSGAASSGSRRTPVVNIFRGLLYLFKKRRSGLSYLVLKLLLRLKATIAIVIGTIRKDTEFTRIYEEARQLVS